MKILIAEDDPVSRHLLETFLRKWGYDVVVTCDGEEAWNVLHKKDAPNLIVSDWMMPKIDGLTLCRKIRGMQKSSYTYVIILTAKERKEDVVKGLEAGADDFLIKPFHQEELKYRIQIGRRIIELEQRILVLASTDSLTGVLNRRAFIERLEIEINRSMREKTALSLMLTDIDYFKRINDKFGHQVGDLVLQKFTEQLSKSSRPYDFVGRYGGEEFVICLPGGDEAHGKSIAERMRSGVEKMKISLPNSSQQINITASFGLVSLRLECAETVDTIIKRVDEAMYKAKHGGKNRVCLSDNDESDENRE